MQKNSHWRIENSNLAHDLLFNREALHRKHRNTTVFTVPDRINIYDLRCLMNESFEYSNVEKVYLKQKNKSVNISIRGLKISNATHEKKNSLWGKIIIKYNVRQITMSN